MSTKLPFDLDGGAETCESGPPIMGAFLEKAASTAFAHSALDTIRMK